MSIRREFRNKNPQEYWRLHREIRYKCKQAKKEWLSYECEELEQLQQLHDDFNLHRRVKQLSGTIKKSNSSYLLDDRNQITSDHTKKLDFWGSI